MLRQRFLNRSQYYFTFYSSSFRKEVVDQSDGCGAKFSIVIVSELFQGKPPLSRHRLVHGILEEELKTIHAISLTTLTPEQWEKTKS